MLIRMLQTNREMHDPVEATGMLVFRALRREEACLWGRDIATGQLKEDLVRSQQRPTEAMMLVAGVQTAY